MGKATWRERLRYRFDNLMARGAAAQILLLAVLSAGLVLLGVGLVIGFGLAPAGPDGATPETGSLLWSALMHALDAGNVAGDEGGPAFLSVMMLLTLGGIFVLSALIGIINNGITQMVDRLRQGRSRVVERGHTVILGFTPKIHALLAELAEANANQPRACVVVLADRDKVTMDEEIRDRLGRRLRVVTRSGSPLVPADLELTNPAAARSIVVLSLERDAAGAPLGANAADTVVLKALLALSRLQSAAGRRLPVVAEILEERTMAAARIALGDDAALIHTPPLVGRLLVQTGRQSGLSSVYTELLDFAGNEIYVREVPEVVGRTFRETLFAFEDSAVMGVLAADGALLLPPAFDRRMAPGDRLIAVTADDDTLVANGRGAEAPVRAEALAPQSPPSGRPRERTLVLGVSERLPLVLRELDAYLAPGSETVVVGDERDGRAQRLVAAPGAALANSTVRWQPGDPTDRAVLDGLEIGSFDHVLVLSESDGRSHDEADARTILTLLHLRDIAHTSGRRVPVTSEILDPQNRELASVAEPDDFVVSNTLVALFIAQVSENPVLLQVFRELIRPEGYETYLRPAALYVQPGAEVDFYAVTEAAARRDEVALGYRIAARAADPAAAWGVVLDPRKSDPLRFAPDDGIVVLASE